MRQNITVSLENSALLQLKQLAAQRHLSLSALVTEKLEQQLVRSSDYEQAKRQALALLNDAQFDLGGHYLSREEIHAR
jgi:hypothetical protein